MQKPEYGATDLAVWSRGVWTSPPALPLEGISTDTRTLQPGNVYVALKGESFDGHAFIEAAFDRGASAAIVETAWAAKGHLKRPFLAVSDSKQALMSIARGYRATLPIRITAVTGSVGKTSVKEMAADVLARIDKTARTRGNWNNDIGTPLSILGVTPDAKLGVFEVGMNHPGELAPLCDMLKPTCGIITTIGPVHLEFFPSVEAIAVEKATVFASLPSHGMAVISKDEKYFDVVANYAKCRLLTTSLAGDADYVARRFEDSLSFTVEERATGETATFDSPLPGEYVVSNALLAIALGRAHGVAWADLVETIAAYKPLYLRWQAETRDGVEFINDAYNANPVSMRASIRAFGEHRVPGLRWLVLAGMRELGATEEEEHRDLGRDLASGSWGGLVTVGKAGHWIGEGAMAAGMKSGQVHSCMDAAGAAHRLRELVKPGDAVLLKASRGEHLEDVVNAWNHQHTIHKAAKAATHVICI